MKIIVVGTYQWGMYSPAFVSGFKELGHEVIQFDTDPYKKADNLISRIGRKISFKYHIGYRISRINKDLISLVRNERPNLVFFYKCYDFYPKTYKKISKIGARIFTYNNDDPFSAILSKTWDDLFIKSLFLSDYNFVYRKKNLLDYHNIGVNNIGVLLPYYIKRENFYINAGKDIPVGFIGHYENDGRDLTIKKMLDNGIPITIFGSEYWQASPIYEDIKSCMKTSKSGNEYNYTINRLQIALVFFSKLNNDVYTRRCFEIPATKTLMLCEYTAEMDNLFPENECAVYFRSSEELCEKCKWLLDNPKEIKRIGENGCSRLNIIGGNEVDRCSEIITIFYSI